MNNDPRLQFLQHFVSFFAISDEAKRAIELKLLASRNTEEIRTGELTNPAELEAIIFSILHKLDVAVSVAIHYLQQEIIPNGIGPSADQVESFVIFLNLKTDMFNYCNKIAELQLKLHLPISEKYSIRYDYTYKRFYEEKAVLDKLENDYHILRTSPAPKPSFQKRSLFEEEE